MIGGVSPETWTLVASVSATLAVVLGWGRPPHRVVPQVAGFSAVLMAVPVVVGVLWWLGPPPGSGLALAVIVLCAAIPVVGLLKRQRAAKAAARVADRVVETADLVAAELAVGLPPGQALANASESWPVLAPVVEAERLGADVPAAWRNLATLAGARDLEQVAAAWEVATRTGGGLADAMTRVAEMVRADRVTARIVGSELASARATARLVAILPVAALAMGTSDDSQPLVFLLTEPWGLSCLAGGLAFGLAGLWWIENIAAGVER